MRAHCLISLSAFLVFWTCSTVSIQAIAAPAETLITPPPPSVTPSETPLAHAESLLEQKKFQEAIDLLSPRLETLGGPEFRTLGRAYSGLQNNGMAIKTYSLALAKNAKDFEAKTLIGKEYFDHGNYREAMIPLREAIDINPKYEPPYLVIEKIYLKKKNLYELRMLFQDMIKQIGEKSLYVTRLCELSRESSFYEDAKQYCRRGIVINKAEARNYVNLAIALKDTGALDEAKSLMKRAAENFPNSEFAQVTAGKWLDEQKNYVQSSVYYKAATVANSTEPKNWISLGYAQIELQKYQDAFDSFKKACELSPEALQEVRHAMSLIRMVKADDWVAKFDGLSERCGLKR